LSSHGITSRRNAEKLILEGRVFVNGERASLGQTADPENDSITVDGALLKSKSKPVYLMLNKPVGYLTTASDDRGRKTVMDLVTDVSCRVYPVGRLDINSTGLLLFTNDGEFANKVMHPSYNKHKTYIVEVSGDVDKAADLMRKPVKIDDHAVLAISVESSGKNDQGGILKIVVSEGRNRQVRKMCAACGVVVKSLKRTSIGSLELGDLKNGKWRFLTDDEVYEVYGQI